MHKLVLGCAVLALLAAAPALGTSHSRQSPQRLQMAAMRQQIADLGAQVKTLQKQVKTLQKQVKNAQLETAANYAGDACLTAETTDALQGTWLVLDQVATAAQARTYFNAQTALDDKGACKDISVGRALPAAGVPPSIAPFGPLVTWLYGS